MATLTYNGIELDYIHSSRADQEVVYSEDGVEYLYTKVRLTVQAIINTNLEPANPLGIERPGSTMNRIRQTLLLPRQNLIFATGTGTGDILYNIYGSAFTGSPAGMQADAAIGPHPIHCNITAIKGTEAYMVDYAIEFYLIDCAPGPLLISHRWQESVSIDINGMSVITRNGKAVVRADVGALADTVRQQIVPPLYAGFNRTKQNFAIASDGLSLMYTIEDEEQFIMPPPFASKAEGSYILMSPMAGVQTAEVRVHLEGSKLYNTSSLLGKAITICIRKLSGTDGRFYIPSDPTTKNMPQLVQRVYRHDLWKNSVDVQMTARYIPETGVMVSGSPLTADLTEFDIPPFQCDGQEGPSGGSGPAGSAQANLLAAAFRNSPCSTPSVVTPTFQPIDQNNGPPAVHETPPTSPSLPPDTYTPGSGTPVSVIVDTLPDFETTLYDFPDPDDTGGGVYTVYEVTHTFKTDPGTKQLPTNQGPVYVSLYGAQTTLRVNWKASRTGNKPRIPSKSINPNAVLLRQKLEPLEVTTEEGTIPTWSIRGEFLYGFLDPSQVLFTYPVPPYLDNSQIDNPYIEDADLNQRISNPEYYLETTPPSLEPPEPPSLITDPPLMIGRVPS